MLPRHATGGCVLFLALACGGASKSTGQGGTSNGSGGAPDTAGTGAMSPSGGSFGGESGTGSASGVGGSPASAGAPAAGGQPSTGGSPSTGGFAPTGGATRGGGGGGGATSSGGLQSSAGAPSTGGFETTGGVPSTGGFETTGGATGHGGAETTGGAAGTGGTPGGHPRFVGNTTTRYRPTPPDLDFAEYWDQMTVENAGHWSSVQPSVTSPFNWSTLDAIYDYAETNGILFKEQSFIWGAAQPGGVTSEDDIVNWISSFCERYPNTALIDVVTEPPPHTEPTFVNVMGGGTNGDWQWITNAFSWARDHCPGAVLILNDYDIIEWAGLNEHIIELLNTALANGAPIDAVGAEAHDLDEQSVTPEIVTELLQNLHQATGLPVYITEMDIDLSDDQEQLEAYQQYFPLFRNTDFVPGITIWGWIYGATWMQDTGLVREGEPRPAMTWLMNELERPVP